MLKIFYVKAKFGDKVHTGIDKCRHFIAVNTAKAWLSVLEATYQVIVLRSYFANVGKRLVKAPKVYFTDRGTLCYLAGLRDPEHAAFGPMGWAHTRYRGRIRDLQVARASWH